MRFKAVTVGIVLAGTALGSAALTLGRARGAAWIGQPLELVVPVQMDPGQADGALCAEADVFHGDSRQDSSRIQVVATPSDQPDTFNLKITSTTLIDEPVVTVYLRAGCNQKSSRRFVLLADFPSDSASPLSRTATSTTPQVPLVIPVQAAPTPSAIAQAGANGAEATKAAIKPTKPSVAPAAAAKPVAKESVKDAPAESRPKNESTSKPEKPSEVAKPVTAGKPRLRLDPIETLNERVKTLEATTTGTTVQEDLARDGQKMQMLQSDLKTLLDQAVKNEANLVAMRERLEKAESDRVPVALVYGLVALVVLCLGALAFLLIRRPKQRIWENLATHGQSAPHGTMPPAGQQEAHTLQQNIDVDLTDMDDETFDRLLNPSKTAKNKAP